VNPSREMIVVPVTIAQWERKARTLVVQVERVAAEDKTIHIIVKAPSRRSGKPRKG
jgi:hypothetical protein